MGLRRFGMGRIGSFLRLSTGEKWLLWKAWCLLAAVRIGLAVLPYRWIHGLLRRLCRSSERRRRQRASAERLAWVVTTASRVLPGGKNCLLRALVVQCFLERRGYSTLLHFGVARTDDPDLRAHAWLECEGQIVMGDEELDRFTPMTPSEQSFR